MSNADNPNLVGMPTFLDANPKVAAELSELTTYWDDAELRIKQVERLRHEVVFNAINELRYAGRFTVQLLDLVSQDSAEVDAREVQRKILEARDCLKRAEYDAVDAAFLYVDAYISQLVDKVGLGSVMSAYPAYLDIHPLRMQGEELLVQSRQERHVRVDAYRQLTEVILPKLISAMNDLRELEPALKPSPERRLALGVGVVSAGAVVIGAVGALFVDERWPMVLAFLSSVSLFFVATFVRTRNR